MSQLVAKPAVGHRSRNWLRIGGGLLLGLILGACGAWGYVATRPAGWWDRPRDEAPIVLAQADPAAVGSKKPATGPSESPTRSRGAPSPTMSDKSDETLALVAAAGEVSVAGEVAAESSASSGAAGGRSPSDATSPLDVESELVVLPPNDWSRAGIETAPASYGVFSPHVLVTGTVAINDDRVAHVYPLSEGILREVRVRLGERVAPGQVLATVDSKEVGTAKLALVQDRLEHELAEAHHDWDHQIHVNVQHLIELIEQGVSIPELEQRLADQPMGTYREQLITAYAESLRTAGDYERLSRLKDQQIAVEKEYLRAKSESEAAGATLQALLEQIKFEARHNLLTSEFHLQEASTQQRVSEAQLMILGFRPAEIASMDPLAQGETISHYAVQAPLAGTVIDKHAVLNEHVGPELQLFEIADLTTVWINAHVFEKDLAAMARLADMQLEFTASAFPGEKFVARVLYTGDVVAEDTRTVRLLAAAENADGRLKPGMFVEIHIPLEPEREVLQVPAEAVLAHGEESFVFVARGEREFERRAVETGRRHEEQIEIVSGVAPGEPVVVSGGFALKSEWLRELIGGD